MDRTAIKVEGMSCSHCENAIKQSVGAMEGVNEVFVNLEKKTVSVDYNSSKVSLDKIKKEIEDQGYDVL